MIIETGRFGRLTIESTERIQLPFGVLGFPEYTDFCLVDPGDETLILWMQSLQDPKLAFPVLEPKVFTQRYTVNLSSADLRELRLKDVKEAAVLSILTIPNDISQMTANLKAPLVINLRDQIAKQVVLQENEYVLKQPMFKELRTHLMTIQANQRGAAAAQAGAPKVAPVQVGSLPASTTVKSLELL
ncbi:MAG: flagellar assembly protein FliW [Bacteriovoracia bacterium]